MINSKILSFIALSVVVVSTSIYLNDDNTAKKSQTAQPNLPNNNSIKNNKNKQNSPQKKSTRHHQFASNYLNPTPVTKLTATEAIDRMRHHLKNGDPRKPELFESKPLFVKATKEQLNDPELYQQYEQQNEKKVISLYLSQVKDIPLLQEKIINAEITGNRTESDINEAKQALVALQTMKTEWEQQPSEEQQKMNDLISELAKTDN
ncbi:MAG: hypothetical protein HON94_09490 [Methylococcales bacterium]|jgi:hypothetical protein|nr:hypothetical protein [Methylococcales bacterium]MBT7410958.1 hypothetical protein [Methylococcales bacterium]